MPVLPYPDPAKPKQMLDVLETLPRLPYRHYFWPAIGLSPTLYDELAQVARICGGTGVAAKLSTAQEIDQAVKHCQADANVKLSVQLAPWHYVKNPINEHDPRGWCRWATDDLTVQRESCDRITELLAGRVPVSHVYLDQEMLREDLGKPNEPINPSATAALIEKNNATIYLVRHYFPEAEIHWFAYEEGIPWHVFDDELVREPLTGSCYSHNELSGMFAIANRMHEQLIEHDLTSYVVNVALAGYYERGVPEPNKGWEGKPYAVAHSWHFARAFWVDWFRSRPDRYKTHTNLCTGGYFWPHPMSPRCGKFGETSRWLYHFLAYVWGAANEKESANDWLNTTVI